MITLISLSAVNKATLIYGPRGFSQGLKRGSIQRPGEQLPAPSAPQHSPSNLPHSGLGSGVGVAGEDPGDRMCGRHPSCWICDYCQCNVLTLPAILP